MVPKMPSRLCLLVVALLSFAACRRADPPAAETPTSEPVIKYGVRVQAGPMDSVLLKDYLPESSLVVPRTPITKARFGVIDVHTHSDMNRVKTPEDVDAWVKTMDEVGVETSIVFTGAVGEEFERQAALFRSRYPKRFQVYCDLLTENIDAPDYPERAVGELVRCYEKGAAGVGELSDKGWGLQGGEPPRDQRLEPVVLLGRHLLPEAGVEVRSVPLEGVAQEDREPERDDDHLEHPDVPALRRAKDEKVGRHAHEPCHDPGWEEDRVEVETE